MDGLSKQSEGSEWNRNVCWRETCVKWKFSLVGLGEMYFHLVVRLWYFDVNRCGLVCFKVVECTFSVRWGSGKKGTVTGETLRLSNAVG